MKGKNAPYKHRILACISILLAMVVLIFGAYLYSSYVMQAKNRAEKSAAVSAGQIRDGIDEKLRSIKNYYIIVSDDQELKWVLENEISYSDYSHIKDAMDVLAGNGIVTEYVSGYTFINFRTGWVISNKGMFSLDELVNREEIQKLFDYSNNGIDKNYWNYCREGSEPDPLDANWRITANTNYLSLILKIPNAKLNVYGMIIVNADMGALKSMANDNLSEGEALAVADGDGNLIFTTDLSFAEACRNQRVGNTSADRAVKSQEGTSYLVADADSGILNWTYYVGEDLYAVKNVFNYVAACLILLILALLTAAVFIVTHILYRPVSSLVNRVMDGGQGCTRTGNLMEGKEFQNIVDRIDSLLNSNVALEEMVDGQQRQVLELFGLRLICGEVSREHQQRYLEQLRIKTKGYYAAVTVILQCREEDEGGDTREDAVCMDIVHTMPEKIADRLVLPPIYHARAIICIVAEDDRTMLINQVMELYEELKKFILDKYSMHISIGVSAEYKDIFQSREAYKESAKALSSSEANAVGGENTHGSCSFYLDYSAGSAIDTKFEKDFEEDLSMSIMTGDSEQACRLLDEFIRYLMEQRPEQDVATVYLVRIVNTIIMAAIETELPASALLSDSISVVYQRIIQFYDFEKTGRYIRRVLLEPVLSAVCARRETKAYMILDSIRKLIDETNGDITLSECAQRLHYHPTYLWKVLKMEKDKSFSDYLEEYKLERAKCFLTQTTMTVAEISEKLHYTNAQNFIRFFSRMEGTTPGKYRQNMKSS